MERRLMILIVTAPEPSKRAEERRSGHVEMELEGVGIMEGEGPGERGVIVRGSSEASFADRQTCTCMYVHPLISLSSHTYVAEQFLDPFIQERYIYIICSYR